MANAADYAQFLQQLYNDPSSPGGFAGVDQLWLEARKRLPHIPREAVKDFLEGSRTYTLHRPRRVHFKRSRTIPAGYMTDFQSDLADMQALSKYNQQNKYILVGIDVLSKRVFATPIKTKGSKHMVEGFERLFSGVEMLPHRVYSDKGKEFTNSELAAYFKRLQIDKYNPGSSTVKAALAENFIRRLKSRLYRYMSEKHTRNWVDVLAKVVESIYHAPSRVLGGLRPVDVSFHNAREVRRRQYGPPALMFMPLPKGTPKPRAPKFKVGDHVRMSRNTHVFTKGYLPTFHDEILEVTRVKPGGPRSAYGVTRYAVKDEQGEPFKGYFYEQELTRVKKNENTSYRVEKVIREKMGKDGKKKYLVKFFEYPAHYWISEEDFV